MNAVIHLLKNDDLLNSLDRFYHNKSFYQIGFKHFVITDIKSPQKFIFKETEQIFYDKNINSKSIFNIIKMIKELNYENILIINNNKKEETIKNFSKIDEVLNYFAVVNNFIYS